MHPLFGPLLVALTLALSGCGAPERGDGDDRCLDERGCPAPAALPGCVLKDQPTPVSALLADPDAFEGSDVEVRGVLTAPRGGGCTRRGCLGDVRCCNTCTGALRLADSESGRAITLAGGAEGAFDCRGDESLLCCPVPTGGEVVVRGRLVALGETEAGPVYELEPAAFCTP